MGTEHGADATPPLAERLRARGLRLTAQRTQVLAAVTALEHATPESIGARLREEAGPGGAAGYLHSRPAMHAVLPPSPQTAPFVPGAGFVHVPITLE